MRIYRVKILKTSVVVLFLFLSGASLWGSDAEEYEREVYENIRSLFTYVHGGVRFRVEDGNVIGRIVAHTMDRTLRGLQPPRVIREISFGEPARFKEHLRKVVTTQVTNPNRTPKEEQYLDHVISILGGLKDQEAVPLLKEIVFNSTLPSDIRSTAMDTLAAIDFEGNLEMFFEIVDRRLEEAPSNARGDVIEAAYRIIAHLGTSAMLDRLEVRLTKETAEIFKAMVRRLIAKRRAELAGEEKKE